MLVKPFRIVENVTDIDLDELWREGIRGFIFDLDNTLMAPHSGVVEDHIDEWLKKISEMGFQSIIVSNNPLAHYTQEAGTLLNMEVIGNAAKPRRKSLRRALEILSLQAPQVVVVGDRPLTDIWGGQRLGSFTILVDPLMKKFEHPIIKMLRRLERLFVHKASL